MVAQVINITSPDVFQKYSSKYNIYRGLYELGTFAVEARKLTEAEAESLKKAFLKNSEFCFTAESDGGFFSILAMGPLKILEEISNEIKSSHNEGHGLKIRKAVSNFLN